MSQLLLSTWSFGVVANAAAWPVLKAGGSALDAVVAGATAVEDDESIDCVGVGGKPDADGQVSLDACVMTDPARCGAVAHLRSHAHPTAIARRVMERTRHIMLVGDGAESFADREGFARRSLLTEAARHKWLAWRCQVERAGSSPYEAWTPPRNVNQTGRASRRDGGHDTVCVLARDRTGQLAGACSTSGLPYKLPGRVGDSPIIGHGLYVDQKLGAAAATGNGELIMGVCASFLAVELMGQGCDPKEACLKVLRRLADRHDLLPDHQVALVAAAPLARGGAWASAALRPGFVHVVSDAAGTRVEPTHATLLDA